MRECLRLAYNRKTNKQIAIQLGLEEGTVKGYMAEAIRILGARGKVDAAEALHAHEAFDPTGVEAPSGGVDQPPATEPATLLPSSPPSPRFALPFRQSGDTTNELSVRHRLAWIVAIAIGIALGLGAVASAVRLVSDLATRG